MDAGGVGPQRPGADPPAAGDPAGASVPTIWLLGSSDYSARLAAEKGMPYVFAHHFSGSGTAEALELYRSTFRPSPELAEPRTFLTVNAVVAPTEEEARPAGAAAAAGDARAAHRRQLTPAAAGRGGREGRAARRRTATWSTRCGRALGDRRPGRAPATRIAELAATYGVDEVMVHPVAGAYAGTEPGREPRARGDAARCWRGVIPRRIRVSPPFRLNWRVGPTWVCFVVPRGCPDHARSPRSERFGACPG